MKRILLSFIVLASVPTALGAQAVVLPAKPLDATRAKVRDALLILRDSVTSVLSSTARLQRDFRSTSAIALSGRAREIAGACERSVRTIGPTRAAVAGVPTDMPGPMHGQAVMLRALDSLKIAMDSCGVAFGAMGSPGKGEEVRGYGNRRAVPVIGAISRYERSFEMFVKSWGIEIRPLGARPDPLAG